MKKNYLLVRYLTHLYLVNLMQLVSLLKLTLPIFNYNFSLNIYILLAKKF